MNELRDAALGYAHRGWRVFPLHGIVNGACTCGRGDCSSPGKHPLVRRGLYVATADEATIQSWWRRWRSANVGIATGAASGIAVIDVDLPTALASLGRLVDACPLPTFTGLTGGGGLHLVYASEDPSLGNSAGRLPGIEDELPGVDLRANGGYIVAPPSVHRSESRYEWIDANREPAPVPGWLKQPERTYAALDVVREIDFEGDGTPYGLAVLHDELDRLRAAQVGTRNHQLNRSAFALAQLVGGGELLETAARPLLLMIALACGLGEPESRQTIDSAFEAGVRQPRCASHRLR
ncbi:MAG: bifunctional DNA primase/polymerase [Actinobacteria bacterium]|nr:bifunctional DNA primase/polymerase [Actinomycetota bacterium]